MELLDRIFSIRSDEEFSAVALEVFEYQKANCTIYRSFVESLNWPNPTSIREIPFLPIEFFKSHSVIHKSKTAQIIFKSSGTGGARSTHFVADNSIYERSFRLTFEKLIGNPSDMIILALLPNYIEQGESSLVYMVNNLINSSSPQSAFVLDDINQLEAIITNSENRDKQIVLFGVSYALLDLCILGLDLSNVTIIETGGMKGRRKELTKEELHRKLSDGLKCKRVYSEYGMTELLSQAYSIKNLTFNGSPWFRVLIRDTNDPLSYLEDGKTGGVNVIDLANLYSCSFIATQDLGRINNHGFEIMGRFDNADIRGCNLLVQ